jgi:hypothetical protein
MLSSVHVGFIANCIEAVRIDVCLIDLVVVILAVAGNSELNLTRI